MEGVVHWNILTVDPTLLSLQIGALSLVDYLKAIIWAPASFEDQSGRQNQSRMAYKSLDGVLYLDNTSHC